MASVCNNDSTVPQLLPVVSMLRLETVPRVCLLTLGVPPPPLPPLVFLFSIGCMLSFSLLYLEEENCL